MVEGAVSGRCRMPIDDSRRPVLALSASTTLAPPITQKRMAKIKKDQIWAAKRVPNTPPKPSARNQR